MKFDANKIAQRMYIREFSSHVELADIAALEKKNVAFRLLAVFELASRDLKVAR